MVVPVDAQRAPDVLWWYVAGPLVDVGTLPQGAAFGAVGAAWERPPFRWGAQVMVAAPSSWNVGAESPVTFQGFGANTRLCWGESSGASRFAACAGLDAVRIYAEGSSLASPSSGGGWGVGGYAGGDWRVRIWGAWFLAVETGAVLPWMRLHFVVDQGPEHRAGVAWRAGVFATRAFPVF